MTTVPLFTSALPGLHSGCCQLSESICNCEARPIGGMDCLRPCCVLLPRGHTLGAMEWFNILLAAICHCHRASRDCLYHKFDIFVYLHSHSSFCRHVSWVCCLYAHCELNEPALTSCSC